MNKGKNRIIFYIIAFAIPIVMILFGMFLMTAYPFGNEWTMLLGDASNQYVQFFRILFDRLAEGKSFLFSWDSGMGYDFLTNYWYYLSDPFNLIVLLFGKNHIELGMICVILLQSGACAVSAMYYFMHTGINKMKDEKCNPVLCLLFSTAYALCDYILAYKCNMMWLMGMILIPLLMLGVEYLVEKNDSRLYGILLFIGFISNFYYAWFLCIWAIICFIEQRKQNFEHWKQSFIKFAVSSIVSALCAGFVLIPSYLSVLSKGNGNWYTIGDFKVGQHALLGNFFSGFFWSHNMMMLGEKMFTQNNYCGVFTFILVFVYVFNRNIDRLQKIKRITEIVIFSVAMNWIGLYWVLHGFSIPHAYTNRYAVLLIFLLLMTAFESIYKLEDVRVRYLGIVGLILSGIFALVIFDSDLSENVRCYLITMFLMMYLLLVLIFYRRNSIKRKTFIWNLCILGFLELLTNLYFSNAYSVGKRTDALSGTTQWAEQYDNLDTADGERKTSFYTADKKEFAYSQTNFFSSVLSLDLVHLFGHLGLSDSHAGVMYTYNGTTPLTAALFNVRYVLTNEPERFGGYSFDGQINDLYKTDYLAGFGYMLPEAAASWKLHETNMFETQNNFTKDVLGTGELFTQVAFEDMQVQCDACELLSYMDGRYHYLNQDAAYFTYASILLTAVVPENMDLYFYSKSTNRQACSIYIDGESFYYDDNTNQDYANTYHLGEVHKGQKIEVLISDLSEIQAEADIYAYFYQYHDDVMAASLEKMRESIYEIDKFEDTCVSGTVNAVNDGILYTSMPYYRGFTAYVDGEKSEIVKIGDAMMGVRVPEGKHKIEFRYFPYGLKTGIACSIVGICFVLVSFFYQKKIHKMAD